MQAWLACIVVLWWSVVEIRADAACDPRLPHCREQAASTGAKKECAPFWLIPGRASDCSNSVAKKMITIDQNSVSVTPNPIKLPGCFTINFKADIQQADGQKNYLAKVEYNWLNLPQFSSLPCQNASSNGCGGYGNNCYYCDICNSLQDIDKSDTKSTIVSQFRKMSCPEKSGPYTFSRQFCFNDFSDLDKDNNCRLDFLENAQSSGNYEQALSNLKKLGYGTVVAKFTLASNASNEQSEKKKAKEAEIQKTIDRELESKRNENHWKLDDSQYITFRDWYVKQRKDTWHRQEYLPWLLYYNQVGCMSVSFDVCDKQPIPAASGPTAFQCPPSS